MALHWLLPLIIGLGFASPSPIQDDAGWLPPEHQALVADLQDLETYGGVSMRIWISPQSTGQPAEDLKSWVETHYPSTSKIVALGIFPGSRRIGWYVGKEHQDELIPAFLDRVVQEILNPQLGKPVEALGGAIGAVALKSGYTLTRWSRPRSPSGGSILALLALGIGMVALGTYWAVRLFRMGPAGAVLLSLYLSFGIFAYLEWFLWMGVLGTAWAVALLVLSRFTKIRLPTHPSSPEPTRAPTKDTDTEDQFAGGRAAHHW